MLNTELITHFDTPERNSFEEVEVLKNRLAQNKLLIEVIEAYPEIVVVLNNHRQIIAFNKKAAASFSPLKENEIYGLRLGEALSCIHSGEEIAGCGTSIFCAECGAGKALKHTNQTSEAVTRECRITKKEESREASLDFRVTSSCIYIEGERFILFTVIDIADEKRRKALERTFFHDVLNTASAVYGISEILPEIEEKDELQRMSKLLNISTAQLISEIESHRDLLEAENNRLNINLVNIRVNDILSKAADIYKEHQISRGKAILVNYLTTSITISTDPILLVRAIGNLLKNALEASKEGDTITLSAEEENQEIIIKVNNPLVMPASVQLQVFQRSFSTKGSSGRGIGTYSVKLLVENYLGGKVAFISSENTGTTFFISLPHHVGTKTYN